MNTTPNQICTWRQLGFRSVRALVAGALLSCLASANTEGTLGQRYSIPEGKAHRTLRLVALQGKVNLIAMRKVTHGVETPRLEGRFEVREAFERLLQGTPLEVIYREDIDAYTVVRRSVGSAVSEVEQNAEQTETNQDMTELRNLIRRLSQAGVAIAVASSSLAQETDEEGDYYELSPFTVSGEDDQGYRATSTLTGSRLRAPLSDVGASISVITEQFLEDTNSNDLREALVYGAGTEVSGIGGNFSNASGGGTELTTDTAVRNNVGTRVRGLAGATLTRGYFRSNIPFDTYNSDRLEINRGANAILFGVGSPAGIINYSTNQAFAARKFGSIDLQYGRFGSTRFALDYNLPLVEEQLAVRVSLLRDHEDFQQEPAFNEDERIYVAGMYSPEFMVSENRGFSGTTLRIGYETGEIEASNPRSLPPQDNIIRWFEPTPEMLSVGIIPKFTRDNTQNLSFTNGIFATQGLRREPIVIFPDTGLAVPRDLIQSNAIGRQFTINNSSVKGGTTAMFSPGNLADSLNRMGFQNSSFYKTPSLNERSVFDFRNQLIDGNNKRELTDIEALNLSLEQLFLDNQAGVEIAYDKQEVEDERYAVFSYRPAIEVDVNTILVEGEANPQFGRPFISSQTNPDANWDFDEFETFRVTAFAELDLTEKMDSKWGRWLGKHTVTLLYQDEEAFGESRSGTIWYIPDMPWQYGNNQSRFSNAGKIVDVLQYLGPSMASASTALGANLRRVTNDLVDLPSITSGRQFYLREMAAGSDFDLVPANIVRSRSDLSDNASGASKSLREIKSQAVNLQSRLLGDSLIGNIGWREEEVAIFDVNAPLTSDGQGFRLVDDSSYAFGATPDLETSDTLFSWNAVWKMPRKWLDAVPAVSGINLHYNESENFSPPEGLRISPFGEVLSPPTGETKDYGISMEFAEGKVLAKINWYETQQSLVSNGTVTGAINNVITNHVLAYEAVQNGIANDSDGDGFPDFYVHPPEFLLDLYNVRIDSGTISSTNPGVAATGQFVAEGVEFELTANPTKDWTIAFNAAKQESIRDNTGDDAARLLFDTPVADGRSLIDNWLELWTVPLFEAGTFNPGPDTTGTLRNFTIRNIINPFNGVRLQDGAPAQELREWRFNLVTNYKFSEGRLKGFNFGGAYRWQDEVAIGFPLVTDNEGTTIIDVNNPHFGPSSDNVDLWAGYERSIYDGRIDWKLQVNLRNALPGDDLIPIFTQPDGEEVVFRNSESRIWTIRSTFSF